MARSTTDFQSIRSQGGLLPPDLLRRILDPKEKLDGTRLEDYALPPGERLNETITQSWNRLGKHWADFQATIAHLPEDDPATGLTNDKWTLPLLRELGFGLIPTTAGPALGGRTYPISRFFGPVPIHLVGRGLSLDRRAAGVRGAASANPHGLVQEFLNRSDAHLWGIVSNGLQLRILRDSQALSRQSFLEFDLEAMFAGEIFSDFVLLWLVAHASRFGPRHENRPETCWLEAWTKIANEQGTRALLDLRGGVERALQCLGEGFTSHPRNTELRNVLRSGQLSLPDFHGQLLRIVYRLIFLFVAEDRTIEGRPLLHAIDNSPAAQVARERYASYYSLGRLRSLASRIKGSQHSDLWQQFQTVSLALSGLSEYTKVREELALPALGSFLWSPSSTPALNSAEITNHDFLDAIRNLGYTRQRSTLRPVDYRNLGSEELGGVYETLLALTPQISADGAHFTFAEFAGNERKTSGSYYTPDSLVQCLLDSTLDPVVEEAIKGRSPADAEKAILSLKVCDPAVGSGHFLVGAAHRMAKHLALQRALAEGESEPSPLYYQHALRDVIGRCLYGVDINPMAAELCRVSLWLEALEPGKPLSFLDHHIQVGNSLLGATPALLSKGIPDGAFNPLEGDDGEICRDFKRINRDERQGQGHLFTPTTEPWDRLGDLAGSMARLNAASDDSFEAALEKQRMYEEMVRSGQYLNGRFWADAWCAAFVWKKTAEFKYPITEEVFRRIESNPHSVDSWMRDEIVRLANEYQFFHWHLAFPDVFQVAPLQDGELSTPTGWVGGFDVVLGNPPWERIKLQEKEWFAERRPDIAKAPNAAARKRAIQTIEREDPNLWTEWQNALRKSDGESVLVRSSGRFPLCGRGDTNTFSVFAEENSELIKPQGRAGFIVPTGIATDDTTKLFFQDLVENGSIVSLYDFQSGPGLFSEVGHARFKFCLLTLAGHRDGAPAAEFAFFLRSLEELQDSERRFELNAYDIALLNPNTRTCPIFRSRHDAELTKAIYRRVPILLNESDKDGMNPWGVSFLAMFHMSGDSPKFRTMAQLLTEGWTLNNNIFATDEARYLPLYEAKMVHQFDHRFGDYADKEVDDEGTALPDVPVVRLQDSGYSVRPRYWVPETAVEDRLSERWKQGWMIGWRDICRSTDERTVISGVIPAVGAGDKFLLMFPDNIAVASAMCSILDSYAFDYCARQKLGGTSLKYFTMRQLPFLHPSQFANDSPWNGATPLMQWIADRTLELVYTSWDVRDFAQDLNNPGPPFRWDNDRRFLLRCELDAAMFHLYLPSDQQGQWLSREGESPEELVRLKDSFRTPRDAVSFIMNTFPIVQGNDERKYGEFRTKRVIIDVYDAMAAAVQTGIPYERRLDPPPADPSCRHPRKKIGILAFGSLIKDPGEELLPLIQFRIKTQTPFPVEYGRISATRGGAPTLVPHEAGGPVSAQILVLSDDVSVEQARNILYRREIHRVGSNLTYTPSDDPKRVQVREYQGDPCVETVLYTDFHTSGKIPQPNAVDLAKQAIESVSRVEQGKDGISYLIAAIASGIQTPLTDEYRAEILRQTEAMTLEEAMHAVQPNS